MIRKTPLIRPIAPPAAADAVATPRTSRRRLLWLVAAAVVALLVAGGALVAARLNGGGSAAPADEETLEFAAPLGGPDGRDGPWLRVRLAPARAGDNVAAATVTDADGGPLPNAEEMPVSFGFAPLVDPTAEQTGEGRTGGDAVEMALDGDGWWRVSVTPVDSEGGDPLRFYLLLPDPNLYGGDAIAVPESDPAAEAVFARGLAATTALHRVAYRELMGDGLGHLADSTHAVNDGSDGQPPASRFRATDGTETVLVGDRRWLREDGAPWRELTGDEVVLPREWGEAYAKATGWTLGGTEVVDGEPSRIVTFAVPEQTEPRRQEAAWYAWWVGEESGQVRRETMVSRFHYMIRESSGFDEPLPIAPPVPAAATPAASPVP